MGMHESYNVSMHENHFQFQWRIYDSGLKGCPKLVSSIMVYDVEDMNITKLCYQQVLVFCTSIFPLLETHHIQVNSRCMTRSSLWPGESVCLCVARKIRYFWLRLKLTTTRLDTALKEIADSAAQVGSTSKWGSGKQGQTEITADYNKTNENVWEILFRGWSI